MRGIDSAAAAVLEASGKIPLALLVDMPELDPPLRVCTGRWNLSWGGDEYIAVGQLGQVGAAQESASGPQPLQFSMTGVPASQRARVLAENVQGKPVSIYVAIFSPDTYQILDAVLEWEGALDVLRWSDDGQMGVVTVTAESAGADLLRGVPVRYTDQDQQRLYAGDIGFQYVVTQGEKEIKWPAASYFRR